MRLYWEVAVRGFRRYATYRAATAAGLFTNTIFGFMRAYVFVAVFRERQAVGGYDLTDALTYTFLTQGVLMTVHLWGWWEIAQSIRSGDVVTDLFRPYDYQTYWLSQDLGRAAFHLMGRGIVPFLAGALVFDLRLPERPITWAAFLASIFLAVCVSFGFRFILNLSTFWFLDYRGIGGIFTTVWMFLGGFIVPVAFFPGTLGTAAGLLPFAAAIQTPIDVFLEKATGAALAQTLALQAAWAVALLALGRLVLARATRKVVTQGG